MSAVNIAIAPSKGNGAAMVKPAEMKPALVAAILRRMNSNVLESLPRVRSRDHKSGNRHQQTKAPGSMRLSHGAFHSMETGTARTRRSDQADVTRSGCLRDRPPPIRLARRLLIRHLPSFCPSSIITLRPAPVCRNCPVDGGISLRHFPLCKFDDFLYIMGLISPSIPYDKVHASHEAASPFADAR